MRDELRFLCLVLSVNAQGPTGRSLHFPGQQGTLLLHCLHEEALRRDRGSTPIARSCLAMRGAAELFHKLPRKRVSKQATAKSCHFSIICAAR